ncbi:MAG: hypothetical protein QXK94_05235 [Candidatus Jordarchaeales archaeon]
MSEKSGSPTVKVPEKPGNSEGQQPSVVAVKPSDAAKSADIVSMVKIEAAKSEEVVAKKPAVEKPVKETETREDLALLRMIVSLMEDVAKTVLRVERLLNERFSLLEKRMEEIREDLVSRVESVELKGVSRLEEALEKTVSNLQKGMEIMAIKDLVEKVENLALQIREGKVVKPEKEAPKEEKKEVPPPTVRRKEPGPAKPARMPAPVYEEPKPAEEERLIKPSDLFRRGY